MSHPTDKHCDTCHCDSKQYLAIVPTSYEIYAVANTEAKAKRLALKAALEFLSPYNGEFKDGVKYRSMKDVEEQLGCNVYPLSTLGVGQEG